MQAEGKNGDPGTRAEGKKRKPGTRAEGMNRSQAVGVKMQGRSREWKTGTAVMLPARFLSRGRSTQRGILTVVRTEWLLYYQALPGIIRQVFYGGAAEVDRPVFLCYIKGIGSQ